MTVDSAASRSSDRGTSAGSAQAHAASERDGGIDSDRGMWTNRCKTELRITYLDVISAESGF